jgi:hypothetical protein
MMATATRKSITVPRTKTRSQTRLWRGRGVSLRSTGEGKETVDEQQSLRREERVSETSRGFAEGSRLTCIGRASVKRLRNHPNVTAGSSTPRSSR